MVQNTVLSQVEDLFSKVAAKYDGRLSAVANCVGNVATGSTAITDIEDLHRTMRLNLDTSFNVVKYAAKTMLATTAGRGHGERAAIVLVSAALAEVGVPNFEAMSAAKAAVEG